MYIALTQENLDRIQGSLQLLPDKSNAHTVMLVARSGLLISHCGDSLPQDLMALAALSAANFEATAEIARMVGEMNFTLLFHKGENENVHLCTVCKDFLLVTIFRNGTSIGIVRLLVKHVQQELSQILSTNL